MTRKTTIKDRYAFEAHPFAEYVAILGRGKKATRSLTEAEAEAAMGMVLDGQVEDIQLGAFLMLLRVKEETPAEVAGFVKAVRARLPLGDHSSLAVDLDWSSYAGKRRQLPWFILAALLLAQNGVRLLMHGTEGHTAGRLYTRAILQQLGVPSAEGFSQAARQLEEHNFAYLPLEVLSPVLRQLIELRPLFGLRSPVHTIARMINPAGAAASLQGIFHPGYLAIHQGAAALLNEPAMAVLRGEGGEAERNPDTACKLHWARGGQQGVEEWSALFERRHIKPEQLDPATLAQLWRGEVVDEYGEWAVIATTALALWLLQRADSQPDALEQAEAMWRQRPERWWAGDQQRAVALV